MEKIGVKRYKIGSGEVNNFLLLEKIAQTGKPVILSSGMSSFEELDRTVAFLQKKESEFFYFTMYHSLSNQSENYGLNVIKELKERYGVKVGYSDHSAKIETCIAAAALGAEILEFHAVFDRRSFGPDASSSLEIDEIKQLVKAVRNIQTALEHPVNKNNNYCFSGIKDHFRKIAGCK